MIIIIMKRKDSTGVKSETEGLFNLSLLSFESYWCLNKIQWEHELKNMYLVYCRLRHLLSEK